MRSTLYLLATVLALATLAGGSAHADRRETLGRYERLALDHALDLRGLALEPAPEGKVLGRIHVVNLEVFGQDTSFFTLLNLLHRTTRERVIDREVLLRPGQVWDEAVVEDSLRRLRDPTFSALAVMVPVRAPAPGQVDLLVVTRDIWSLRLNSLYELQGATLSTLILSPSENNLLGWRKQLAGVFAMDLGAYELGPLYVDKNLAGTRMQLRAQGRLIFERGSDEPEGSTGHVLLAYPLWSLQRQWGAELELFHRDAVVRRFEGTALRTYDNPDTPDVDEGVPYRYPERRTRVVAGVTRALGDGIKHHLSAGYALRIDRFSVPEEIAGDEVLRAAFARDVLQRSERSSALLLGYRTFSTSFVTYRDMDTFDLPEELRQGLDMNAGLEVARKRLGADSDYVGLSGGLAWLWDLGGNAYARAGLSASGRLQDGALIDNLIVAELRAASPTLGGLARLTGRAELAAYLRDTRNLFLELGGANGLRGYRINDFAGDRRARVNLELRTMPVQVWFSHLGVLGFWDMGHAADRLAELRMHHDVGAGLRVLIPQLQPTVFRFDWAVPLTGATAGLPGRFIAGAEQVF